MEKSKSGILKKIREKRNPEEYIEALNKMAPQSMEEAVEQGKKSRIRRLSRQANRFESTKNNNMSTRAKGKFTSLDPDHEIFTVLAIHGNPPKWWIDILEDKELYIEIRKDNYINVYYYGGCLIKITYNSNSKKLRAETHQKYIGDIKDKDGNNESKYCNCIEELETPGYIRLLKKNIKEIYLKDNDKGTKRLKEDKLTVSSEKKVQGEFILNNRDLYIDSEFAYALPLQEVENENKIIRFDLVRLKEGVLSFVELKLISDPRLRGKNIDIIKQMKKYSDYINDNKDLFVYYYLKVAKIKYKIGILKEEPSIIRISKKPILLLVNNYSELTDGRIDRIKDIESILRNEKIDYTILDYSKCE